MLLNVAQQEGAEFEAVEAEKALAEEEGDPIEEDGDQTRNLRKVSTDQRIVRNFDMVLGPVSRMSQSTPPPHTPPDMLCRVPVLVGCWLVLAIRRHARFLPLLI